MIGGTDAAGAAAARSLAGFGGITPEGPRQAFPAWRIFRHPDAWRAMREGIAKLTGPRSLIRHVHAAPDLTALAEKLCLQEHLDGLDPEGLAAVYRGLVLPEVMR